MIECLKKNDGRKIMLLDYLNKVDGTFFFFLTRQLNEMKNCLMEGPST